MVKNMLNILFQKCIPMLIFYRYISQIYLHCVLKYSNSALTILETDKTRKIDIYFS